jgi:UPF0755 protein
MARKKRRRLLLIVGVGCLVLIGIAVIVGLPFYNRLFKANVRADIPTDFMLYIPTGSSFETVMDSLMADDILIDTASFRAAAAYQKYDDHVRPGRYRITGGMNNRQLVVTLRSQKQNVPVRLTINKKRLVSEFVEYVHPKFEFSENDLERLLTNDSFLQANGFNRANALVVFVQNTYEVWWNSSAEEFYERMKVEYERFWNEDRLQAAAALNLTPQEVTTLASIVEEETNDEGEKSRVAGLYLNRLNKNMLLQADPTLRYAAKDFGLQRILNRHKEVASPYNTYLHAGLPPGPICIPSVSSIDAVLRAEQHDYLFMCANADFSGRHAFAKTLEQHNQNAAAYQAELNRRGIR